MESIVKLNVCKCECSTCSKIFYEWEDECLDKCPHCGASLSGAKSANVIGTQTIAIELDKMTGSIFVPRSF